MSMSELMARFRALHVQAKKGTLTPEDRLEYERSRADLGRTLLLAQQMSRGGKTLRSTLRVAQLVKVDLELGGAKPERTSTIDLASGGFAVLLAKALQVGRPVEFTLHLPGFAGGVKPVRGDGKVASARQHGALHRVSVAFEALDGRGREDLEMVIIDAVLARFSDLP